MSLPAKDHMHKMMKKNNNTTAANAASEWKGFTLEEMRYQRAAALARCTVYRESVRETFDNIVGTNQHPVENTAFSLAKSIAGNLKFIDYLVIGFKVSRTMLSLWRRIRR